LPDQPSKTVKENHGGVFLHYEKNRFMTPRELARLQSFDDNFIFKGSKSQILVQIGNAVPPKLGFEIADTVKEQI
jgi:DNA (cytosine-5)-methyltransferase 1